MIRKIVCFVMLISTPLMADIPLEQGIAYLFNTRTQQAVGEVTFEETPSGILISGNFHDLPPGEHAFHIHEYGDFGNLGKNAGGHYNPQQSPHGYSPPGNFSTAHVGDLGNVVIDSAGEGKVHVFLPGVFLSQGRYTIAGRSLIMHDNKDDFSQPVGNAGDRMVGGSIVIVKPGSFVSTNTQTTMVQVTTHCGCSSQESMNASTQTIVQSMTNCCGSKCGCSHQESMNASI